MRIAVIGSGISGLACAWLLSRRYTVTLYESQDYLGGHTHTHHIMLRQGSFAVDSGFIVYNTRHYPLLAQLFRELDVVSQPTTMSFALRNERTGLEYNATSLNGLFCQRRNLLSPRFLGMVRDLLRFYREAPEALGERCADQTLAQYLETGGYGDAFREDHLVPMAAALWSCPPKEILALPVRHLVQFMANHQMLRVTGRPTWQVVQGGSSRYISRLRSCWKVRERLSTPVCRITRYERGVEVRTRSDAEFFDYTVLACHSNQALQLLSDATTAEREILGSIRYQPNEAVLHTDAAVLPTRRSTWAAWNVLVPDGTNDRYVVSYCMNLLQGLSTSEPLIVSLNAGERVQPNRILRRMRYEHPLFSHAAVAAQKRKPEIQGPRRTWFAGAYWGWGFHEDGVRSAVEVAHAFGVDWPDERRIQDGSSLDSRAA